MLESDASQCNRAINKSFCKSKATTMTSLTSKKYSIIFKCGLRSQLFTNNSNIYDMACNKSEVIPTKVEDHIKHHIVHS